MANYFKAFPTIVYKNQLITDITRKVKIMDLIRNSPYAILPYVVKENERPEDIAYYYYGDQNKVWLVYLANNIVDPYTQWPLSDDDLYATMLKKYSSGKFTFSATDIDLSDSTITINSHNFSTTDPVIYNKGVSVTSGLSSSNTYYVIRVDENRIKLASSATNAIAGTHINLTSRGDGNIERNVEVFLMSTSITCNIAYAYNNADRSLLINSDTYAYGNITKLDWTPVRFYEDETEKNEDRRHIYLVNLIYADQLQSDLKKVINV